MFLFSIYFFLKILNFVSYNKSFLKKFEKLKFLLIISKVKANILFNF